MYIAAMENTGITFGIISYCIAKYPVEAKLVKDEIFSIFKSPDDIQHSDLSKLDYTNRFIKECFRLYGKYYLLF